MGMSTHVKGFVPPDERWQKMKAVLDACTAAGIEVPDEVDEFFGDGGPDPQGQEVDIPSRGWKTDHQQGIEIKTEDIPERVKVIRFYNSW